MEANNAARRAAVTTIHIHYLISAGPSRKPQYKSDCVVFGGGMPAGQFAFIIFVREPGLVSGQNNARLITLPTTALLLHPSLPWLEVVHSFNVNQYPHYFLILGKNPLTLSQ